MFAYNKVTITFITEMILMVVLITAFIISIWKRNGLSQLRFFSFYLGYILFVFICGDISYFIAFNCDQKPIAHTITSYTDYSSTFVELLVFLYFIFSITHSRTIRKSIPIITILFLSFYLIAVPFDRFFPNGISEKTQSRIYTVEALLLLIYSSFNLLEILKNKSKAFPGVGVNFWITVGYFLFAACTLPYSLLEPWLRKNYEVLSTELYSLFYIFYSILFYFIIRAYLTKNKNSVPL